MVTLVTDVIKFTKKSKEKPVEDSTESGQYHWYLVSYSYSAHLGHGEGSFFHYSEHPYVRFSHTTLENFKESASGFATDSIQPTDSLKNVVILGITNLGYGTRKEFVGDD